MLILSRVITAHVRNLWRMMMLSLLEKNLVLLPIWKCIQIEKHGVLAFAFVTKGIYKSGKKNFPLREKLPRKIPVKKFIFSKVTGL